MTVSDYLLILGLLCGVIAGMILALKFAVVKPKITALLLDADGTLLDFDRAEQTALEKAFSHFGYPFSANITASIWPAGSGWRRGRLPVRG